MATARDIITRTLRLIHVLDSGESPTADEANDGLTALNDMLDSMSVPGLYIYALREDIVSWTSGQASRTIGASGDFNITRPNRIEDGTFYRSSDGIDYPLKVIRLRRAYNEIVDKSTQSTIPSFLYYEPDYPLGTLYLYPVPSVTAAIHLQSQEQLSQFATLDTAASLPPGYKELITAMLCPRLATEFGVALPPEAQDMMRRASRAVRRANSRTTFATLDTPGIDGAGYSVYSDA